MACVLARFVYSEKWAWRCSDSNVQNRGGVPAWVSYADGLCHSVADPAWFASPTLTACAHSVADSTWSVSPPLAPLRGENQEEGEDIRKEDEPRPFGSKVHSRRNKKMAAATSRALFHLTLQRDFGRVACLEEEDVAAACAIDRL